MRAYARWVLRHRILTLGLLIAVTAWFASLLPGFGVDVGSGSLVLEDDPDLEYYDESRFVFGSDEYVMISFRAEDVFAPDSVAFVRELTERLQAIPKVSEVLSLTTIRLYRSPKSRFGILGLAREKTYLGQKGCDVEKARAELLGHSAYERNVVSPDGKVTSLLAYLDQDPNIARLELEVHRIDERLAGTLAPEPGGPDPATATGRQALLAQRAGAHAEFRELEKSRKADRRRIVGQVRALLDEFRARGHAFHVSGLPFILVNMVEYIEQDLYYFGVGVLLIFFVTLYLIFRRLRWVVLPLTACAMTVIWVMGIMVLMGKQTTVVTSNISSLLMVIAMAHSIYLILQYGELRRDPARSHEDCVAEAVARMARPCFFVAAAGVAGFASLLISHIKPVMEFGTFMAIGVGLAFVQSFLVFPAGMSLMKLDAAPELEMDPRVGLTLSLARFTEKHGKLLVAGSLAALVFFGYGASLVRVETRFIDYFKESSEIYRGLLFIDREMGGTTSLEVILTGPKKGWFWDRENLDRVRRIQEWLDARPEVGKSLTIVNQLTEVEKILQAYTGKPPDPKEAMKFLLQTVEPETRKPYLTEDGSSVRVLARMKETWEGMNRVRVIRELREFVAGLGGPKEESAHITGIFVLYTNMLESLVWSQLRSLLLVFATLMAMLWILFRSFWLALYGMIPNTLPTVMVFGSMGWLGIHLDMATVMVASVSLGFAVDPAIQYVVRYREEALRDGDLVGAMYRSNASIGRGIFYTSLTIIVGFWVLALSQFKPTIYFGTITGVAMAAALVGSLTGLPLCLIVFKPVKGRAGAAGASGNAADSGPTGAKGPEGGAGAT